jgi:hypothetical protein
MGDGGARYVLACSLERVEWLVIEECGGALGDSSALLAHSRPLLALALLDGELADAVMRVFGHSSWTMTPSIDHE